MHHSHLIAFLAVLAAGAALPAAAEVPPQDATPLQVTKPDIPLPERIFQQPNEIQWFKINLEKGKDYAIGGVYLSEDGA